MCIVYTFRYVEGEGSSVRINLLTLDFMDERTDFSQGTLDRIMNEVIKRKDELMSEWEAYREKN